MAAQEEKFKAVTTFTVIADMARNVAGDAAIVESITKAGAEHLGAIALVDILQHMVSNITYCVFC